MGVFKPLAAALFFFECFKLLALVVFLVATPPEGLGGILSVYLSSNALFPLMALFAWLKPEEYRNYLSLFVAGKVIVLVSFYIWLGFSFLSGLGLESATKNVFFLGGCFFVCILDLLSVCGAWMIKAKFRHTQTLGSSRGMEAGGL